MEEDNNKKTKSKTTKGSVKDKLQEKKDGMNEIAKRRPREEKNDKEGERPKKRVAKEEGKDGEKIKKKPQKYAKHGQKLWKRIRKEYKERKAARKLKESSKSREARHADEMRATLFLKNVPLSATEEDLEETFNKFGELRYAKIVKDKNTNLSKGTAFLCFKERSSAEKMLEEAYPPYWNAGERKESCITLMGRQLGVAWALQKEEAEKIAQKTASEKRKEEKQTDKRNMSLAGIGYELSKDDMEKAGFSALDINRRLAAKQEKLAKLKNPNLFVSQTRLSIRFLPHGVDEKMLKMIAKQAAISGLQHLYDEDESDDEDEDEDESDEEEEEEEESDEEEKKGKKTTTNKQPKVVIKQVKIVKEKEKVDSKTGTAKLKNFGFVEYETEEEEAENNGTL